MNKAVLVQLKDNKNIRYQSIIQNWKQFIETFRELWKIFSVFFVETSIHFDRTCLMKKTFPKAQKIWCKVFILFTRVFLFVKQPRKNMKNK